MRRRKGVVAIDAEAGFRRAAFAHVRVDETVPFEKLALVTGITPHACMYSQGGLLIEPPANPFKGSRTVLLIDLVRNPHVNGFAQLDATEVIDAFLGKHGFVPGNLWHAAALVAHLPILTQTSRLIATGSRCTMEGLSGMAATIRNARPKPIVWVGGGGVPLSHFASYRIVAVEPH